MMIIKVLCEHKKKVEADEKWKLDDDAMIRNKFVRWYNYKLLPHVGYTTDDHDL